MQSKKRFCFSFLLLQSALNPDKYFIMTSQFLEKGDVL